jgi:hypothetical protein
LESTANVLFSEQLRKKLSSSGEDGTRERECQPVERVIKEKNHARGVFHPPSANIGIPLPHTQKQESDKEGGPSGCVSVWEDGGLELNPT